MSNISVQLPSSIYSGYKKNIQKNLYKKLGRSIYKLYKYNKFNLSKSTALSLTGSFSLPFSYDVGEVYNGFDYSNIAAQLVDSSERLDYLTCSDILDENNSETKKEYKNFIAYLDDDKVDKDLLGNEQKKAIDTIFQKNLS